MKLSNIIILPMTLLAGTALAAARVHHHPRQEPQAPAPAPAPVPVPAQPVPAPPAPAPAPESPVPPLSPAPPAPVPPAPAGPDPVPAPAPAPAEPVPIAGPNCGKGYTYCGYMLSANGHNFSPEQVSKAYCEGLNGNCDAGTSSSKTDVSQAVFVCLDDAPNSSIQLLCACEGKCLNEAETNNIAHCDSACYN
ncbi:hypothetical protein MN608_06534 [Microdochium nivale]|nr:hypothetical protein MN608_06534 [Microdochium nivale]